MTDYRQATLNDLFKRALIDSNKNVFSPTEIMVLIGKLRNEHPFPRPLSERKFQRTLTDTGVLKEIILTASYPLEITRYHFGTFSDYELALSLKPGAHLSHGSAAYLHNLTDAEPETIYVNKEQSPKNSKGILTQAGIDRAFATKQRTSAYIVTHQQRRIILLSGKYSGRLGVTTTTGTRGEQLELTNVERTLIDIAVRPAYAGGAKAVARAYRTALPKISIAHIAKLLAELSYIYPYHQVVGFYLQNAGLPLSALQPLREPGLNFDFYVEHGMKDIVFDSIWKVHFPEDIRS